MTRRVALGAVAWCLVVLVGSVVVWQAIGAAGRDIFDDEQAIAPTPTNGTRTTTTTPSPSSAAPTTQPTDSGSPATTSPAPTGTMSTPVTSTWQGRQGRVVVSCTEARAALESASPADGHRMEIDERGPSRVRVEFSDDEREVRVESRCIAGTPRFDVDESGSGSSG